MSRNAGNGVGFFGNSGIPPRFTESSQRHNPINFYFGGRETVNINVYSSGTPNFYGIPPAPNQSTSQHFSFGQHQSERNQRNSSDQSFVRPDFAAAEALLLWPSSGPVGQTSTQNQYPMGIDERSPAADGSWSTALATTPFLNQRTPTGDPGVIRSSPATVPRFGTSATATEPTVRRHSAYEDLTSAAASRPGPMTRSMYAKQGLSITQ